MLLLLQIKRGYFEVPGLRKTIIPEFAFTAPLGLVHPMTRMHVRLLGPCFKTGRRRRRPTRTRDKDRTRERARCTSPFPSPPESGQASGAQGQAENFTHCHDPRLAVRRVERPGKCSRREDIPKPEALAGPQSPSSPQRAA